MTRLIQALSDCRDARIYGCRLPRMQHPELAIVPRLLCPGCYRPRRRRAAEQRDEVAAPHSITSSALASNVGGTVRPSIRAVSALMTNSNLLDCITGRSAGFAPLRIRPT